MKLVEIITQGKIGEEFHQAGKDKDYQIWTMDESGEITNRKGKLMMLSADRIHANDWEYLPSNKMTLEEILRQVKVGDTVAMDNGIVEDDGTEHTSLWRVVEGGKLNPEVGGYYGLKVHHFTEPVWSIV